VLPSQFIASSENRLSLEANKSPDNDYIAGYEGDWNNLCVWIKPRNLGELYSKMIDQAKNVIIVSQNCGEHNHLGTCRGWVKDNISILHDKEAHDYFRHKILEPGRAGYDFIDDKIPHWEFAMEPEQITNLERYCNERGKRTVMISTGDWGGFIPAMLYKKMYEKNDLRPEGITFNMYWSCHPFYESEFLRIPVASFEYGADVFVEEFRKLMGSIDFSRKDGEYLLWSDEFSWTRAMNPATRFESWGFPTVYRTDMPSDIWCFGWDQHENPRNPTREYILPKIKQRHGRFREFRHFVSLDELIDIACSVNKVNVTVHKPS
jgi:hypothetical protein